jgi:hypothetical protein
MANGIQVPFLFKNAGKVEKALLDSEASHNFLDPMMVEYLGIQLSKLTQPVLVLNVDSTTNTARTMDSCITLEVTLGKQKQKLKFYVMELGEDWVILSFLFLKAFNPNINWHTRRISGKWGLKFEQLNEAKRILRELQIKALKTYRILREGKVIYLKWQSFTQQWSTATHKTYDHLTKAMLPAEYQNHTCVFKQKLAAWFPPSRAKYFTITLKPDAQTT